ncbi:hypothetical protein OX283_009585 [Flavobacterium sp. SUN052]|uniref:hypothetical protein n=1 Tax=Flavobacterium sp. SUN052 TaxID=3002441 RepID=UPI00237D7C6B|nr:hypothetical protein [Flavobacterium sp. SUN052]MEC4004906.1 hypothetical protein [Flavobacterium sp. SUN052]
MTKKQIIEKVKTNMKSIPWLLYDKEIGLKISEREKIEDRNYTTREVYVIFFKTIDTITYDKNGEIDIFIEGDYCSCYVDAVSYEILYYSRPHGYIETDGTY